ncbi:MAG: hypothetical protein ACLVAT_04750 [Lachnospiraceae bacterium]
MQFLAKKLWSKEQSRSKETVGASVRIELDTNNQTNYGSAEDFGNGASGYTYNGDFITEKIIDIISKLAKCNRDIMRKVQMDIGEYRKVLLLFQQWLHAPGLVNHHINAVLDSSLDTRFLEWDI